MSEEKKPGFDQRPSTQVRGSTHALRLATDEQSEEEAGFDGPTEAISAQELRDVKAAGIENLDKAISTAMTHEDLSKADLEAALQRAQAELKKLKNAPDDPPETTDEIDKGAPAATMMMGSVKEADLAAAAGSMTPAAPPLRSHQAPPAPGAPAAPPVVAQQQIDTGTGAPAAPPAPAPAPPAPLPPPPAATPPPVAAPVAAPGDRGKPTNQLTLGAIQPLHPESAAPSPVKRKGERDMFWWMVGAGVLILGACLGLLLWLLMKGPAQT